MTRSVETSTGAPRPIVAAASVVIAIPRGRPTAQRAAAIEKAIRTAAREVFGAVGFDAATMEQVAQGAQVSKGTLYARFDSKEQLFRAVIEDELVRWSERAGENDHLLPVELGPRLRHHARVLVGIYGWPEYQRIMRLVEGALTIAPGLAQDWKELGAERYLEFLSADMAQAAGNVAADWDFLARLFLFSISSWQRHASVQLGSHDDGLAAFVDQVVATIESRVGEAARR